MDFIFIVVWPADIRVWDQNVEKRTHPVVVAKNVFITGVNRNHFLSPIWKH